jgi:D-alanyl-D-alanine carboxypeptidase/D-alanyl-D-alanine-endopeptidase (penicillin-binding protein 4)
MSLNLRVRFFASISISVVLLAFLAIAGCTGPDRTTSGQTAFETGLSAITSESRYAHASWGIVVVDPATGATLYGKNADQMFVPASTTKLFSAAAVLEALGPDYRFVTPVYSTAAPESDGSAAGDLVLVASGDPSMGGRTLPDNMIEFTNIDHGDANALQGAILTATDPLAGLNNLASQVKSSRITTAADVVIDDRLFGTTTLGKAHIISPIVINDNYVDITITPGASGAAPSLAMRPQTAAYRLVNKVTTGQAGAPLAIGIKEDPAGTIIVSGTIAADAGPVNQTFTVKTPAAYARTLFIEALERQGVDVKAPATGDNPADKLPVPGSYAVARKVAELTSPPLSEDAKLTLKVSQNMHADTYIMLLAAASNRTGFYDGMQQEGNVIRSLGLDTGGISLGDGEGGVEEDQISPMSAARLLTLLTKRPYSEKYVKALPVLGVDGSLASACSATNPACGHVFAKTGTRGSYNLLNDQGILLGKSLAGYVDTKSGKRLVFAVYVNKVPFSDVNDMMAVGEDLGNIAGLIYEYY